MSWPWHFAGATPGREPAVAALLLAAALLSVGACGSDPATTSGQASGSPNGSPNPSLNGSPNAALATPSPDIARPPSRDPKTSEPQTPLPPTSAPASQASNPATLALSSWGVTVRRSPELPWQGVVNGFEGARIGIDVVSDEQQYVLTTDGDHAADDIYFGACDASGCAGPHVTLSLGRRESGLLVDLTTCWHAPANWVFDCLGSNDAWPILIEGSSLKELVAAWHAQFGAAPEIQATLGGGPAIIVDRFPRRTLLAVHGDVLVAIIAQSAWDVDEQAATEASTAVADGFRFAAP